MTYLRTLLLFLCLLTCITEAYSAAGLKLNDKDSHQVHFTYNDQPLLSFGSMSDLTFYMSEDANDYQNWADWQFAHGMNHIRAQVADSWIYIEEVALENGGDINNVLFPFQETINSVPGDREFDLSKFNQAYWNRFKSQLQYLQSKGIIVHLMMTHGLSLNKNISRFWQGHFFNPINNINANNNIDRFDDYLGPELNKNRNFWNSVGDNETELFTLQKLFWEKIIIETAYLDNIYYDLVTEIGESYDTNSWNKVTQWIDTMAAVVRTKWAEINPNREIILGMDAGSLDDKFYRDRPGVIPAHGSETHDVITNPNFNIIIWGNIHHVENLEKWRKVFKKPIIPQESLDELEPDLDGVGQKWTYRIPAMRTHIRKYVWKMMMGKAQQIDIYMKNEYGYPDPGLPFTHNYDPNGHNEFENDAPHLRTFWNNIQDYPTLLFNGEITNPPSTSDGDALNMVLSSNSEAVLYLSAPTIDNGSVIQLYKTDVIYSPGNLLVNSLALVDGEYEVSYFDPASGVIGTPEIITVTSGNTQINYPEFTDDLIMHVVSTQGCVQSSYLGTPFNIGDTIEAEHFDTCGEGVAYHDLTTGNLLSNFRNCDDVDITLTSDLDGGFAIEAAEAEIFYRCLTSWQLYIRG